ncbi:MAG: sulfite exporter TauE/SafE family protein [Vicinamibacterales bacterium]
MTALAWLLAAGVGLALGVLGGGGSILTVPVFTYVLGFEAKQAIAMSLPVVGIAAAAGAVMGIWRGTLPLAPALMVGAATMVGAFGGARLATLLAGRTQLMLLAIAMLSAAVAMWFRSRTTSGLAGFHGHRHPLVLGAVGLAVGTLTGIVGIGGGFLIVPALVIAGGLPMREATAASLLVIALSAAAGMAGYFGHVVFAWRIILPFAAMSSAGVIAGGVLAGRISQQYLQRSFAVALVLLACYMLATR